MAVVKRGLLIGGAALAGILALAGLASASTRPTGGGTDPEDPYSPEACEAYRAERDGLVTSRNQAVGQMSQVNNAMQAAADQGDEEGLKYWVAQRTKLENSIFQANRRIEELNDLIAGCN